MHRSPVTAAALGTALLFAVAGCSGQPSGSPSSPSQATTVASTPTSVGTPTVAAGTTTSYPLTLIVPGEDAPLSVQAKPVRIAALSPDAAIAIDELIGTDRLVAIPSTAQSTTLNPRAADFAKVPNILPGSNNSPDPELVLSWKPDLVVITSRHTGEQDASAQLTAAGAPVLTLTNGWSTVQDVTDNLTLLGKALDAQGQAATLVAQIRQGVDAAKQKAATASSTPSVLILSNQAQAPFVNADDVITSELVADAGGTNAAAAAGAHATMPVQPEQVVAANPDYVMLVDVLGKGRASFDSILSNPAVAALPAVKQRHVKLFPALDVYGLAGSEVVDGIDQIQAWIHPELG